jgi:hypothetical protein
MGKASGPKRLYKRSGSNRCLSCEKVSLKAVAEDHGGQPRPKERRRATGRAAISSEKIDEDADFGGWLMSAGKDSVDRRIQFEKLRQTRHYMQPPKGWSDRYAK